jgi:hypothetical protein
MAWTGQRSCVEISALIAEIPGGLSVAISVA